MARPVSTSNVVLPPIRTLFPHSTFSSSPSSSPSSDEEMPFTLMKHKRPVSHEQLYPAPRLPFPLSVPRHAHHNRRTSTASTVSSVPSLTYSPSPSPSPPPSRPEFPQRIRLVPCALQVADVVVVASGTHLSPTFSSHPSPTSSLCPSSPRKSSGTQATLLVGSAISRAGKDERKMHPYRILRERRA